jgi:anaerobic selenocysteine-containing dehydrogenase
MTVTRRRFIGLGLGAAGGAVLGIQGGRILSELGVSMQLPPRVPGGPEKHILSVCRLCPGGCGIRARCIANRAVKLEGNPLHPINAGRLCPKGQAGLQSLYHPDRIQSPLRRVGPRGAIGSFTPTSWEEALQQITVRLGLLRNQHRPETLVLVRGTSRGLGARLATRFMRAFGSPNDVSLYRGDEAASQALELTQGLRTMPVYDLQSAEYVLSFGGALLEAWDSPVYAMRAYGEFRQGNPGRRGKLVQVEPRQSATAVMADEWIAVRPGTEGIMAMGVAAALVAEELYDKEFVLRRTHQFEDYRDTQGNLQPGFRTLLERDFGLERVSAETGVSVNRILSLAREFAAARPSIAIGPRRGPLLPGRLFEHLAAHLLNALVGNLDGPGGVLVPEPVPQLPWPEMPADPVAQAGLARPPLVGAAGNGLAPVRSDVESLAEAILAKSPYGVEALFVLDSDPAFVSMAPALFTSALEHVPLVVSFATHPDDTALLADWILPQSHPFEAWDLDTTPPGVPFPLVSLAKPVLPLPQYDTRSAAQIFLELAKRLGGETAAAFPWPDVDTLIRAEVRGLYGARRGAVIGTSFDEAWVRMMERAGWWAPGYRSEDELWQRVEETGGWWDPFYDHWNWGRVLQTGSGKFEFRPKELAELAVDRWMKPLGFEKKTATDSRSESHLALLLFEPLAIAGGLGAQLPFLQEILDPGYEERWESWVELHPETAESLGVVNRSWVRVVSPHGSVRVRAQVSHRVVPGVAAIPLGLGQRGGGRWAEGIGANPLRLLSPIREPLSGLPDPGATWVRVVVDGTTSTATSTAVEAEKS